MQTNQNSNIDQNNEQINYNYPWKEISFVDYLDKIDITSYNMFVNKRSRSCCSNGQMIIGRINYNLVISIIALMFNILAIASSFNFCPQYKELRLFLLLKLEEEKNLNDFKKTHNNKQQWCDLRAVQNAVLICNFILISLLIIFEIIQKVYIGTIVNKEKKQGKITSIMIFVNYIFYFFFKIMILVSLYFTIYEFFFILNQPFEIEKDYNYTNYETRYPIVSQKTEEEILFQSASLILGINFIFVAFIWIFYIVFFLDITIYTYLDLGLEDDKTINNNVSINNNQYMTTINNINNTNSYNRGNIITKSNAINDNNINISESRDIIKTVSATINGTTLDIKIKYNKNIYLEELKTKTKHKFKQIFINGVTNDFVYIRIKDEIIENMLSITDWVYPKLDQLYIFINNTFIYIYITYIC